MEQSDNRGAGAVNAPDQRTELAPTTATSALPAVPVGGPFAALLGADLASSPSSTRVFLAGAAAGALIGALSGAITTAFFGAIVSVRLRRFFRALLHRGDDQPHFEYLLQ